MNTLIFSDTHLTSQFEDKKYQFLRRIISHADRIIINGDFWEGFLIPFQEFYNSKWRALFPLLKTKRTTYIFGNHDQKKLNNLSLVRHFSDRWMDRITIRDGGFDFTIEHGHRLYPTEKESLNLNSRLFKSVVRLNGRIEKSLCFMFGENYQKILKRGNNKMKKKISSTQNLQNYFIFGHTHCPEFDEKSRFANSGVFKNGLAQYIMIENGRIKLIKQRYD